VRAARRGRAWGDFGPDVDCRSLESLDSAGEKTGEGVIPWGVGHASSASDSGGLDDSFGTVLWAVSLLLSAIVGVVLTRTSDRWLEPLGDHELWMDFTATPLFVKHPTTAATGVTYLVDGALVEAPYQVRLWVWRAGAKDVRADSFSDDLEIRLGAPVVASTVRSEEHTSAADVQFEAGENATWRVRPSIVRADFLVRYDFISDGLPALQAHNPVADLRISSFYDDTENRNGRRTLFASVGAVLAIGGIIWFIVTAILTVAVNRDIGPWIPWGMPVAILGTLALASSSEAVPRRARLARKRLHERAGRRVLPYNQVQVPDTIFERPEPSA